MQDNYSTDILFIGNFQLAMEQIEEGIAKHLPSDKSYRILTYRKSEIPNSVSYEEFITENYDLINDYPLDKIRDQYKDVNLYLALVSERLISNYYFGIEDTLGNKELSFDEHMFIFKSFILFIAPYIDNTRIVFTSYADNFISTLTYYLGEHYKRKCIAFHEISVVDSDSNFLVEGLYANPYKELIIHERKKSYNELIDFMNNYDGEKDREERFKKNAVFSKKSIYGMLSANLFDKQHIKFALKGYPVEDKRIKTFMNLDRPSIKYKLKANIHRLVNKKIVEFYMENKDFKYNAKYRYIYFPLQIQPEASTASRAPFYMNQLATIETISKSLPLGYKLITKEHPLAIGMNGLHFYKKVKTLPNVEFINNKVSGKEIIKLADLVISFGGTTLFESILEGKKILMLLPSYYYDESSLIFKVKDKNDLYLDIINALNTNFSEDEIMLEKEKMLNFFYQRGFPRFIDFEKNMCENLLRIYEMEQINE